jgi:hypothetical protein
MINTGHGYSESRGKKSAGIGMIELCSEVIGRFSAEWLLLLGMNGVDAMLPSETYPNTTGTRVLAASTLPLLESFGADNDIFGGGGYSWQRGEYQRMLFVREQSSCICDDRTVWDPNGDQIDLDVGS